MSNKVQLNETELNQVAGGGIKEIFQKFKDIFSKKQNSSETKTNRTKKQDRIFYR